MKTVSDGSFLLQAFDDVIKVFVVACWGWAFERVFLTIGEWIEVEFILNQGIVKELDLIGITESSIPVINNMPSIHNLPEDVSQIIPWHVTRLQLIDVLVQNDTGVS